MVSDRRAIWLSKLRHAVRTLLEMRYYQCGSYFIAQRTGVPIGGPLSPCLLDLACAALEQTFDTQWHQLVKHYNAHTSRRKALAVARYADDTVIASAHVCCGCLEKFAKHV